MALFIKNILPAVLLVVGLFNSHAGAQSPRRSGGRPANPQRQTQRQPSPTQTAAAFDDVANRAAAARESSQLDEAITLYQRAVELRPGWAEGWWYLGTLCYERDRYAEGRTAFERLIALEPKGGPAYALLGLCQFQLRDYPRALLSIQRGRELGVGDNEQLTFVARYHAAILLTRFGHFENALEILNYYASSQDRENPKIIEALGMAVLRLPLLPADLPAEKRELVTTAGRAARDAAQRRLPEARQGFEQLAARYPAEPNVHYARGVFLLQENAPDAALEEFARELKISPAHVAARLQIAFEYLKRTDYKSARPFAEEAVKLDASNFPARNLLGRILIELGEMAEAIKELEAGVKLAPDSPDMYFALARAYGRAGKKQDAEQARATFLRLDKIRRAQRDGPQAVGGTEVKTPDATPK